MKRVWFVVIGLSAIGYGCGPRLAETPLGAKELEWESYVSSAYSNWTPPQTIPPVQVGVPAPANPDANASEKVKDAEKTKEMEAPQLPPLPPLPPPPPLTGEKHGSLAEVDSAPAMGGEQIYVVKPNDSFWKIAQKFYKDGDKWPRIKEANLDVLGKKKSLQPGMKLRIPAL